MRDKTICYQKNRERIWNRAKEYYENEKERLRDKARNKYRELSNWPKKQKENMEEIHVKICLKKINKGNKIPISLHGVKMEQKAWILVKISLIKMPSIKMKEQLVLIK